ncbi:MAG: hypothetical protein M0006_03385 [Magnetospirillum sp.]|nr:hypothetical protein [Magnetospirillum sp.]
MRNGFIVPVLGLLLSGCALAPRDPAQDVFALRAGFDAAVLAPAVTYATLPACPTTNGAPCSYHDAVVQLDKGIRSAVAALDAAEATVREHPGTDASAAIDGAENAIGAVKTILATYNIH